MAGRQPISTAHIDGAYFLQITKEQHDAAQEHNRQVNAEARDERLAALAEQQRQAAAERDRQSDEQRRAEVAGFRATARMAFPGTTTQFDDLWPEILKQHQLEQMRGRDVVEQARRMLDYSL